MGNPGERYFATRHNLGFMAVERLAGEVRLSGPAREECRSLVVESGELLLAQPQTYMNRSGAAVRCLAEKYQLAAERILVIYDEVHLDLGRIRLRPHGNPAGHRGMESIIDALQTEAIPRLRLGVGARPVDLAIEEFVLNPFLAEEAKAVERMVTAAALAAKSWSEAGIDAAMNLVNRPDLQDTPAAQ